MRFARVAIAARADIPDGEAILKKIAGIVEETGANVVRDRTMADLVIVVGGDGTIIATVREMENPAVPILGVHSGTLGFLSSLDADELDRELPGLLGETGVIDERHLLRVCVEENGGRKVVGRALNEAVVSQGGISRLLRLHATIDGKELAVFRADGLIAATPTGSTAYSLAAGGPIVCPDAAENVTILTPVNPHRFSQKPIIVPGSSLVTVEVLTESNAYRMTHPLLTLDGQVAHPLARGQKVCVSRDDRRARFLRKKNDTFYERIRKKLHWAE